MQRSKKVKFSKSSGCHKFQLLLSKREIRKLDRTVKEKGNTLIPLRLYFSKGKVKVELAVAKGKKSYDKRESIARKDMERDAERKIKL